MAPDFSDRSDFDDAERGFVATLEPLKITDAEGRIVFDLSGYEFLDGTVPTPWTRACSARVASASRTVFSKWWRGYIRSAASICRT